MTMLGAAAAVAAGLAAAMALAGQARAGVHPFEGQSLEGTHSLADVIDAARDQPVHIVFVHGMRAQGPQLSLAFQDGLRRALRDGRLLPAPPGGRSHPLPIGDRPEAMFLDEAVWKDDAEWAASQPYVDRYVYARADGGPVVVDEVNWWPLLFPLKCRFLLRQEGRLSGPDKAHLKLCARADKPYHPWLTADELKAALTRPPYAGGAWVNAAVKSQILNWGLADAVIAVGPMQTYLHKAMEAAFAYAKEFDGRTVDDQEFVIVSESLGSFVVLDAMSSRTDPAPSVREVFERTGDLYFFANQFRILELARLTGIGAPPPGAKLRAEAPAPGSPLDALKDWAQAERGAATWSLRPDKTGARRPLPRQVIAFHDPSDMLTFEVPQMPPARVVNLYDQNGFSLPGLAADPLAAHTGHSRNKAVLKTLFARRKRP